MKPSFRLVLMAIVLSVAAIVASAFTYYKLTTLPAQDAVFTECCPKDGGGVGHTVGDNCVGSCFGHAMPSR
jgi:hypothetical protein